MPASVTTVLRRWGAAALLAASASVATTAGAQNQCNPGGAGARSPNTRIANARYDGRYTFARIAYTESFSGGGGFGGRSREPFWHHDYPNAEQNFTKLITELTSVRATPARVVILTLDDPELFKYPIAYLVEAGHWDPGQTEVVGLRNYLKKGGFIIFDDLSDRTYDMDNLMYQLGRVLPGVRLVELTPQNPVFDAFYRVKSLNYYHPYYCYKSMFYGIFEDNDPKKRLLGIVNYNNDVGEYWEWSDMGFFGVDPSNEAYKLGINYIIYALTR